MSFATFDFSSKVRVLLKEVVQLARRVLERKLDLVQPAVLECSDALLGETDAGSEQVGVVAQLVCFGDDDSTSSRISGSPPEMPSCTAPSSRASRNTRSQSSVVSSGPERA